MYLEEEIKGCRGIARRTEGRVFNLEALCSVQSGSVALLQPCSLPLVMCLLYVYTQERGTVNVLSGCHVFPMENCGPASPGKREESVVDNGSQNLWMGSAAFATSRCLLIAPVITTACWSQ